MWAIVVCRLIYTVNWRVYCRKYLDRTSCSTGLHPYLPICFSAILGAPSNSSGWLENYEGTIFFHSANVSGDAGLDSDFDDAKYAETDAVLLRPDNFEVNGPWPWVCQGLQVCASRY